MFSLVCIMYIKIFMNKYVSLNNDQFKYILNYQQIVSQSQT